jgi:hypothetical protein
MHATGQGRKSDGECASLATARTEGLSAKVQGSSLKLLRIYLMFDRSLPGGYALQLLQDSPELTRHARYRMPLRRRIAVKQVPLALARRTGRASQTVAKEGTVRWSRG